MYVASIFNLNGKIIRTHVVHTYMEIHSLENENNAKMYT
jgi:hypothetical protein